MSVWSGLSAHEQIESLQERVKFYEFIDRCSTEMQRFYERINAFSYLSNDDSAPEANGSDDAATAYNFDENAIPYLLERRLRVYRARIAEDQEKRATVLSRLGDVAESVHGACRLVKDALVQSNASVSASHQELSRCCFKLAALATARSSNSEKKFFDKIMRLEDGNCALANANEKLQSETKALQAELENERKHRVEAESTLQKYSLARHDMDARSSNERAEFLTQKQHFEDKLAAEQATVDGLRLENRYEKERAERHKENARQLQQVVEKDEGVIRLLQKQISELESEILKKNKQLVARKQYIEGIQNDIDNLTAQMGEAPQKAARDNAPQNQQSDRRLTFGIAREKH